MSDNLYDAFSSFLGRRSDATALQPPNVSRLPRFSLLFAPRQGSLTQLVIQVHPQVLSLHYSANGVVKDWRLALPYLLLVVELTSSGSGSEFVSSYAYYRTAPLSSLYDVVYQTNLPNIISDEGICLGDDDELCQSIETCRTDHERAAVFLDDFLHRPFSDHSLRRFRESSHLHPALESFSAWESYSRRDPNFVLRVPWHRVGQLNDLLERSRGGLFA